MRQDPREPRLLFAGTRSTVYVSLDGGGQWQPLTLNLPGVQVRDLAIDAREGELVAATHGRAFWILDDLALLEQLAQQTSYSVATTQLFAPETAWLSNAYGGPLFSIPNYGDNPDYGAAVFFNLPKSYNGRTPLTLTFLDGNGATVRSFTLHIKSKHEQKLTPEQEEKLDANQSRARDVDRLTAVEPGMNRFLWDLRYAPAYDVPGFRSDQTTTSPTWETARRSFPASIRRCCNTGPPRCARHSKCGSTCVCIRRPATSKRASRWRCRSWARWIA